MLELAFRKKDEPIIDSLLWDDFYTFTVGQLVERHFRHTPVVFRLINRSKERLADIIRVEELREQLEYWRTLRLTPGDRYYLFGVDCHGGHMFTESYLEFQKEFRPPEFELGVKDGQFDLRFSGAWPVSIKGEVAPLEIVNTLRSEALCKNMTRFEKEALIAEGIRRLHEKIMKLKKYPQLTFSNFGTRRAFTALWHGYVDGVLAEAFPFKEGLPGQFRGTSNVYLAKKYDLVPMGTNSHQLAMVIAALARLMRGTSEEVRQSQYRVLKLWHDMYGKPLGVALPDAFGSEQFFAGMSPEMKAWFCKEWKGDRQDSGDPFAYAKSRIAFYQEQKVDPREKLIVFSDSQYVDLMIKLFEAFNGQIGVTFGWGTDLTNDLGIKPISVVIKPESVMGHGTVKLSDNLAKAMGTPEDIAYYKQVFGYTGTLNEPLRS